MPEYTVVTAQAATQFRELSAMVHTSSIPDFLEHDKVVAAAAQHRPPVPEKLATESWFPPELISQGDISGESALNGQSYAANDFIRPPYSEGKLIRIENSDYFILELTAR